MATPVINRNASNTVSTHLQKSSDSSADGSSKVLEQKCEETLQASDADNAKRSFKRKIKQRCCYVVDRKKIYPNTELPDGELNPTDDLLKLDVGRIYLNIIQEEKGRKEFGFLSLMSSCYNGRIGALNAESFAE